MPNKGREHRGSSGGQVTPPRTYDSTPQPSGDFGYFEFVMEVNKSLGKLTEAVDTLKEGQKEQRIKLEQISKQVYAGIVVIVLVGGVLGFFANSINNLLTRLIQASVQQQQTPPK